MTELTKAALLWINEMLQHDKRPMARALLDYLAKVGLEQDRLKMWLEDRDARVTEAKELLKRLEFRTNDGKCPECAGWNVSPAGETSYVHTKDCKIQAFLTKK